MFRKKMFPKPQNAFGIKKGDDPILSLETKDELNLGIAVDPFFSIPGLVPLYEEHKIRSESGYNLIEWNTLTPEERALEIARYRIEKAIEYQHNEAEKKLLKKRSTSHGI